MFHLRHCFRTCSPHLHHDHRLFSPVCSVLPASIKLPSPLAYTMANAGQINRTRTICAGCHCLIPFRPPIPESATTSDRPDNISWHYSTRKRIRRVSYQNAFGVGMLAWAPGRERGRDTEAQTHIHTAPIRSQIYGKFARRTHIMVMQRLNEYSQSGLCVCVCACVECKSEYHRFVRAGAWLAITWPPAWHIKYIYGFNWNLNILSHK